MNKIDREKIIARAKRKARKLAKLRLDERYQTVLGRLKFEGLLHNPKIKGHRKKFLLEEAIWVGENLEPRVLELLPAILLKRPGMVLFEEIPDDLKKVLNELRRGVAKAKYKNIEARLYSQWLPVVGRRGSYPTLSKTFRFHREDQKILQELSQSKQMSETEVIREALRKMRHSS